MEKEKEDFDPIITLNKKVMELTFPFDRLPNEVKEFAMEYISFRRELTKESDRGCALLAASHLDFMLEKTLRQILCGTNKHLDSLFDFNGPLGTFSGKILLTYSLGLLSDYHLKDLQSIRKIRNEFGHTPKIISFDEPQITKFTNGLKLVANSRAETSRLKFISSVSLISGTLEAVSLTKKKFEVPDEIDVDKRKNETDTFMSLISTILDDISK